MKDRLNCSNCGAPITGAKCEYCGTMFYDFANIDINGKAGYLRLRYNDKIILVKAYCGECSLTMQPEYYECYCVDDYASERQIIKTNIDRGELDLHFYIERVEK